MSAEFFTAVKAGDAVKVAGMIERNPALLEARDSNGLGAFIVARYSRQNEVAQLLLDRGVQLDIFAACIAGVQSRVVELLAADRSLVNAYSHDGWTPLHLAAFFGHAGIAEVLLANGADVHARSTNPMQNTPLHAAAAGGHAGTATVLLAHGADVNAKQHGGWTPMHAAAQSGDAILTRLFLSLGADLAARAENNQTALDLAMTKGHPSIVELLDKHGAG